MIYSKSKFSSIVLLTLITVKIKEVVVKWQLRPKQQRHRRQSRYRCRE